MRACANTVVKNGTHINVRQLESQGMRLVVAGIFIGVLGAAAFGKIIAGLLYGVTSTDSLTYVAVTVISTLVAALACLVSSWRALRIDPITALRTE
jgi:putative ABC transport system permease protein